MIDDQGNTGRPAGAAGGSRDAGDAEQSPSGGRRATVPCPSCGALTTADLALGAPACTGCGRPVLTDRPVVLGDDTYERVLEDAALPVLVDFHADWCGPCRMMAPLFEQIARAYAGHALVAKLDTERNPLMAARYGVRSIPTLIAFRNGDEVGRRVGAVPRAQLERLLADAGAAPRI